MAGSKIPLIGYILLTLALAAPARAAEAQSQPCGAIQPAAKLPPLSASMNSASEATSLLKVIVTCIDRVRLSDGNELIRVTGFVANPSESTVQVPPLAAVIRAKSGQLIHHWIIAPPANKLAPGARATFDNSQGEIPPGGEDLTITLGKTSEEETSKAAARHVS